MHAYWTCYRKYNNTESNNLWFSSQDGQKSKRLKVLRPIPIHPKANHIISFPSNLVSVVVHDPETNNAHSFLNTSEISSKNEFGPIPQLTYSV